jgi:pimeloyl-ACP methyl ester carboxylesterase
MPKLTSPSRRNPKQAGPEIVDPRWLLTAGVVAVVVALLCALALLWTAFYYTQWQYVLAPSRAVAANPSADGLAFTEVHFGVDATGQPQIDGWWIPADTLTNPTVLLLHAGNGSISDALPQMRNLHDVNLNVLLFDYRGFGRSGGTHPTQALMQADAESALNYLHETRRIDLSHILVYGNGLGASIAISLCASHREIPAVILESPLGDTEPQVLSDTRTKLIPVRLLFHEQFPLDVPLETLATPKLVISYAAAPSPLNRSQFSDPKMTVELNSPSDTTALHNALLRFLDSYMQISSP